MKIAKVISKATKARDAAKRKAYSAAPPAPRGKKNSSKSLTMPTAGKAKSIAREKKWGTPSYKEAKQNDLFVNRIAKARKKSGSTGSPSMIAPKSISLGLKTPKVPVKKRGK